jgi:hypothetical protein
MCYISSMLFLQKRKTFTVTLMGFALFLAVGHLFFFSATTVSASPAIHHDFAQHGEEKDHPELECPSDIHQFTQNDSSFDIADCLPPFASFNVPPIHEIVLLVAQVAPRARLLPQERKTVLLI